MTRADFTRTSVIDPSITGQSNSIPTNFLLIAPKEVFTSIILTKEIHGIICICKRNIRKELELIALNVGLLRTSRIMQYVGEHTVFQNEMDFTRVSSVLSNVT